MDLGEITPLLVALSALIGAIARLVSAMGTARRSRRTEKQEE
jgi:hypothetical protein